MCIRNCDWLRRKCRFGRERGNYIFGKHCHAFYYSINSLFTFAIKRVFTILLSSFYIFFQDVQKDKRKGRWWHNGIGFIELRSQNYHVNNFFIQHCGLVAWSNLRWKLFDLGLFTYRFLLGMYFIFRNKKRKFRCEHLIK